MLSAQGAQAWNDPGHRVIAIAAARSMTAEVRAAVLADLQSHPRYQHDIKSQQPAATSPLSEADWLFGQAANWPDAARSFELARSYQREALVEKYHRGRWHYINFPLYLDAADAQLKIHDPSISSRRSNVSGVSTPHDVLTALVFLKVQLQAKGTSASDRGLWIVWALHLIADAHQPLHSTALFSRTRWPKGDRGGNSIQISRRKNLHAYWDRALTNFARFADQDRLAVKISGGSAASLDPERWLREGHKVAAEAVYGPLMKPLRRSARVRLPRGYAQQAHRVALAQAQLAAARTAAWFEAIYREP
jgi:hypothetical protein